MLEKLDNITALNLGEKLTETVDLYKNGKELTQEQDCLIRLLIPYVIVIRLSGTPFIKNILKQLTNKIIII